MILTLYVNGSLTIGSLLKSIQTPIGGYPGNAAASTAQFMAVEELELEDFIEFYEGLTLRFEGYITKRSRNRNKEATQKWEYTATCRSYYEYSQQIKTETVEITTDDECKEYTFSGNLAEYQNFTYRENACMVVIWPPTGEDPIEFDAEAEEAVVCPGNLVNVDDIEENQLPSHIAIEIKKYREKRFPCIADFSSGTEYTKELIKKDPRAALYGKQYKIMDPDDPTTEYTAKLLTDACVGGSKFFCKGHADWRQDDLKLSNFSCSANINPKKSKKSLTKKGVLPGESDVPGAKTTIRNKTTVDMVFGQGFRLPRVFGAHGTTKDQSECFVRARVLEEIKLESVEVGGCGPCEKIKEINHVEVEVSADTNLDTSEGWRYRDWTFGGSEGMLHATEDLGNGVWTSDLSGTYIEEEGETRALGLLANALAYYNLLKWTTNFTFAGINFDLNKKISFEGKTIVVGSIEWTFGIRPEENRTKYNGIRTMAGYDLLFAEKKRWFEKMEAQAKSKLRKEQVIVSKENANAETVSSWEYAKIAWKFSAAGANESIGELMKREFDGTWETKNQYVWVSFAESSQTFSTAGDNTIFEIERIEANYDIGGVVRDLYRARRCAEDKGTKFTKLCTTYMNDVTGKVCGKLINGEYEDWADDIRANGDASAAYIKTTINSTSYINIIQSYVPNDWKLEAGTELVNFLYLDKCGKSPGVFVFVPDEPVLTDELNKLWESQYTIDLAPHSTYRKR